jgi:hypothetical protein
MLKNNICRLNDWFNRHEVVNMTLLIGLVGLGSTLITLGISLFTGVMLYVIVCFFALGRTRFKFDRSLYKIPEVGEILVVTKPFFWDGGFLKAPRTGGPYFKPNTLEIERGTEWKITEVVINCPNHESDWTIYMEFINKNNIEILSTHGRVRVIQMDIRYFESRGYWRTKSDIRNDKLKRLGLK